MKTLALINAARRPDRSELERLTAADQYPRLLLFEDRLHATMVNANYFDTLPAAERALYWLVPKPVGQVIETYRHRRAYDAVISWSPVLTLMYASLLKVTRARSPHVAILYAMSPPKKAILLKRVHGYIDRIITWSSVQRDAAVQSLGVPASKIDLIPHFVDEQVWRPMAGPGDMICAVGLEMRDYPTLIEAMRGLDQRCHIATRRIRFRNTPSPSLPPNVTVGWKSFVDLRALYQRSRFVVIPLMPTDTDSGVTAILEAMAMGKAVICSRVRGQVDVIEEGKTGMLVRPQDPSELREAIQYLWERPDIADSMGREGRKLVEERHTLAGFVDHVEQAVAEVIAARRLASS
jgi:glycosyltransferase involved in cell wall biosynthesis